MEQSIDIGTLIETNPEIRKGRPCIAGTGVSVRRVVQWYKRGHAPEAIADRIGHLSLAQVYAALAYYHVNRESIEQDLSEEAAAVEELSKRHEN